MSNERNLISDQVITNRAPVRNQDNKPLKKPSDGTMSFMVWSITGTALAACSSPIFSDVADLGGGGGRSGGSGVFTISESSSGPTSIAARLGSVPADGGVYISPDVVHRPAPQNGPEGADIQTGPGGAGIQDAVIMFRPDGGAADGTNDIPLSSADETQRGVPMGEDRPDGFLGDRGMDESGETFYYVSADRLERLFLSFDDTYQVDADFDINLHVYDSANEMFAIDETTARTVPVRFEAVDDAATAIALDGVQTVTSIPEANGIARTKIADLMIDDIDETPLNTLEIVVTDDSLSPADAARIVAMFQLDRTTDGTAIYLREGASPDFETFTALLIRVQSVADSTIGVNISVTVTDVNDVAPMITSGATGGALVEGTEIPITQVVYAAAGDFDVTPIVWSLEANTGDAGLFRIDDTTGAVTFAATTTPNHVDRDTYIFTVVATSGSLTPAEQSVTIDVTDIPSEDVAPVADLTVTNEAVRAFVIINGVEFRVNADSNASPRSDYEILFRAVSANSVITPNTAPGLIGVNITTAGNNDKFSQVNIARLFNAANLNLYDVAAIIREADESATERTITNWQSAETDFIYDFITASTALDFTVTEDDEADSTARGFLEVTGGTGTYTYSGDFEGIYGNLVIDGDGDWVYTLGGTDAQNNALAALTPMNGGTETFDVTVRETGGTMRTGTETIEITVNGVNDDVAPADFVVTNEAVRAFVIVNGVEFRINADSNAPADQANQIAFNTTTSGAGIYFGGRELRIFILGNGNGIGDFSQANIAGFFNDPNNYNGNDLTNLDIAAIILEEDTTDFIRANWAGPEANNRHNFNTASTALDFTVTEDDAADSTARGFLQVTGATDADTYTYTGGTTTVIGTGTNAVTYEIFNGIYGELIVDVDGNWTYEIDNTRQVTQDLSSGGTAIDDFDVLVTQTAGSGTGTGTAMIDITVNGAEDLVVTNEAVRAFVIVNGVEFRVNTDGNAPGDQADRVFFSATSVIGVNFIGGRIGVWVFDTDGNSNGDYSQANIAGIFKNNPPTRAASDNRPTYLDVAAIILEEDNTAFTKNSTHNFSTASTTLDDAVTEDDAADSTARGFLQVMGATDADTYTYTGGDTTRDHVYTTEITYTYEIFEGDYGQLIVDGDGNWTYVIDNTRQATQALISGGTAAIDDFDILVTQTAGTGAGTTGTAMVDITVNGANDAPMLDALTGAVIADSPDSATGSTVTTGALSGMFTATDADTADTHMFIAAGAGGAGAEEDATLSGFTHRVDGNYGMLFYNGGGVSDAEAAYQYVPNEAAINGLAHNALVTESFEVTVTDGSATSEPRTLAFTIGGVNDAPVLGSLLSAEILIRDSGVPGEDSTVITGPLTGFFTVTDDMDDTHTFSATGGASDASRADDGFNHIRNGNYGTLFYHDESGAYEYVRNEGAIDAVIGGRRVTDVFAINVTDDSEQSNNVSRIHFLNVRIDGADEGANAAPTSTISDGTATVANGGTQTATTTISFGDADADDPNSGLTIRGDASGMATTAPDAPDYDSALGDALNDGETTVMGTYGMFTITRDDDGTDADTGTLAVTYTLNTANADVMGNGDDLFEKLTVYVHDGDDPSDAQEFVVTIDRPAANSVPTSMIKAGSEDTATVASVGTETASTIISFDDDDSENDDLAIRAVASGGMDEPDTPDYRDDLGVPLTTGLAGTNVVGTYGTFVIARTNADDELTVTYHLDREHDDVVGNGADLFEKLTVYVDDGDDQSIAQDFVVTIDRPALVQNGFYHVPAAGQAAEQTGATIYVITTTNASAPTTIASRRTEDTGQGFSVKVDATTGEWTATLVEHVNFVTDSNTHTTRTFHIHSFDDTAYDAGVLAGGNPNPIDGHLVSETITVRFDAMDIIAAGSASIVDGAIPTDGIANAGSSRNELFIGTNGNDAFGRTGGGTDVIFAREGDDTFDLGRNAPDTIYHRFTSSDSDWVNTDGGDTIDIYVRSGTTDNLVVGGTDTFIFVDSDSDTVATEEDFAGNSNIKFYANLVQDGTDLKIAGFEIRFVNPTTGVEESTITINYHTALQPVINSDEDKDAFGIADTVTNAGEQEITDDTTWGYYFGDTADAFQVIDDSELPSAIVSIALAVDA